MNMHKYLAQKKEFYELFLSFIDSDGDFSGKYSNLIDFMDKNNYFNNQDEMNSILSLISIICDNHYRCTAFFEKIDRLLLFILVDKNVKQFFSNDELFDIFKSNKRVLLFLIKNKIITFSQHVINSIYMMSNSNGTLYILHFFYPELEPLIENDLKKDLSEFGDRILIDFDKKRLEGENDSPVCSIIRRDSIDEFVVYVNQYNLPLSVQIKPSIFETHPLLSNKKTTLIEYATFFGSIRIFQYLVNNGIVIEKSLWPFAIHSNNPELISILEEKCEKISDDQILHESIKCHHNEIANYFYDNQDKNNLKVTESNFDKSILNDAFCYQNYDFFPNQMIDNFVLCYLCKYNYVNFVELLLKEKQIDYNFNFKLASKKNKLSSRFSLSPLYFASVNNNNKIFEMLLKQPDIDFTRNNFNNYKKLYQISIPSYMLTIRERLFNGCSNLKQIIIPKSVKKIENEAFQQCSSLEKIILPSSVTEIGIRSFKGCTSLNEISIPSSVISIGNNAFENCSSIQEITLPESICDISYGMFMNCSSLKRIHIKSNNLNSIGAYAFSKCSSLIDFLYPFKQELISSYLFYDCKSLGKVFIPPHIKKVGTYTFYKCESLKRIDLPDSITEIKEAAFYHCRLLEIKIPVNLQVVEPYAFNGCFSLKEADIPNVVRIGKFSFAGCISLSKVNLSEKIKRINYGAFIGCEKLEKINVLGSLTGFNPKDFDYSTYDTKL